MDLVCHLTEFQLCSIILILFDISEKCLRECFVDLNETLSIEININIDGLPLYNNGTEQVWPIIFNIHKNPTISPMIVGIFNGKTKPGNVEELLDPFANEAVKILRDGILVNGFKLKVKIRSFICDSPARAFVKGTLLKLI